MTCPHRYSDGAYVLGALGPAERAEYEEHLAGCATCAAGVRELAPLPGLLGRVESGTAQATSSPRRESRLPELLAAMARVRRRQVRTNRWRLAVTALVVAAVTGAGTAVVTAAAVDQPDSPPPAAPMSPVAGPVPVSAQVFVAETAAGTEVWMECAYPPYEETDPRPASARVFRLVAVAGDGAEEQLGSWYAGPGDQVEMTGVTRLTGVELSRIELQDADGAPLLTYQP